MTIPLLPPDDKMQELILPRLKAAGLLHGGHIAYADPDSQLVVQGIWHSVKGMLEGDCKLDPLSYIQRNLHFLFVGTPGGGTTWFSRVLTGLGKKCGHESVFRAMGVPNTRRLRESQLWAECSGFASPWLDLIPEAAAVGLIRHPVHAVNSMVGHLKWPVDVAIGYWYHTHNRDWQFPVILENCWGFLEKVTGRPREHIEHFAKSIDPNSHDYTGKAVTWEDLPLEVRHLANKYGYAKEGFEI